jgi:gliding motility-associated lipoprotein GldD
MFKHIFFISFVLTFSACSEDSSLIPKPRGYFRLDFPEKKYQVFSSECPYSFEFPVYTSIQTDKIRNNEKCWKDIDFGKLHAKIHISFKNINGNINNLIEESRKLAYKHSVKASGIEEFIIENEKERVFGTLYEIGGETASSIQFHVCDSTRYFLRGSLYFYAEPNADSLAPAINFIRSDINHLLETFRWK